MRFDWVPDAGNSFTWVHEWWSWLAGKLVSDSGSEPSKASGYAIFDTPDLAQTFTTEPSEFSFRATREWMEETWSVPYRQCVCN